MANFLKNLFDSNAKEIKKYSQLVDRVNALEPAMQKLSDAELAGKTAEFKQRLQNGASLNDLMLEAFAAVREASVRTLGMRHFDVQLIGGMALHDGRIAEMKTGEGKTLVATLPGLSERAHRQGRAYGDGERIPLRPRQPMDGPPV